MTPNNTTTANGIVQAPKSIVDDLMFATQIVINYLPLIFSILGLIGFIGNLFTYLQPKLRSNTCCIYSLCGSIIDIIHLFLNLFPTYLGAQFGAYISSYLLNFSCKFSFFLQVFLPHLSINFLLMAIIDQFACTCSLTSPMRRLNRLNMVPFMIVITIIISFLASLYTLILYDVLSGYWCTSIQPTTTSVLYIILIGLMQPIVMLIFVLLTYRNVHQSRRRVGGTNTHQSRTHFIVMIFAQIFTTAFFSLQWIIMYMYFWLHVNNTITSIYESWKLLFVYALTKNCYYLNNVKAFYISILTSHLFRTTFIKGLIKLLPRNIRLRFRN